MGEATWHLLGPKWGINYTKQLVKLISAPREMSSNHAVKLTAPEHKMNGFLPFVPQSFTLE